MQLLADMRGQIRAPGLRDHLLLADTRASPGDGVPRCGLAVQNTGFILFASPGLPR